MWQEQSCYFFCMGYLLYQMYVIVKESSNVFGSMMVIGVMVHLVCQIVINVSVADKCNSEYRCYSSFHKLGRFRTSHDHGRVWYVYRNQKAADEKSVSEAFE